MKKNENLKTNYIVFVLKCLLIYVEVYHCEIKTKFTLDTFFIEHVLSVGSAFGEIWYLPFKFYLTAHLL